MNRVDARTYNDVVNKLNEQVKIRNELQSRVSALERERDHVAQSISQVEELQKKLDAERAQSVKLAELVKTTSARLMDSDRNKTAQSEAEAAAKAKEIDDLRSQLKSFATQAE